ncbi:MAG: hypothetical protein KJS98_07355 [Nitrospirae bacterium]|nr:hypothetical protein [Nitrospirota bacterium]MDE3041249.1 hypothetical protein [Nitrospirota bacterium]
MSWRRLVPQPDLSGEMRFGEGALRVFAVEKRNKCLGDIPHMVPLGIPVDDGDRVFYGAQVWQE